MKRFLALHMMLSLVSGMAVAHNAPTHKGTTKKHKARGFIKIIGRGHLVRSPQYFDNNTSATHQLTPSK